MVEIQNTPKKPSKIPTPPHQKKAKKMGDPAPAEPPI
jgi:hypothetical protein